MKTEKSFLVDAGWLTENNTIGTLFLTISGSDEIYSFEFSDEWLAQYSNIMLDPDLLPFRGRQFLKPGKSFFGFLSDAAPDRWGRLLMQRRETLVAKSEGRPPQKLTEADFLAGVHDEGRQGGLRIKNSFTDKYISDSEALAAPPWTKLRTLQNSALTFENSDNYNIKDSDKWFKQLLYPGSSLGGARPKANVKAPDGSLWIAKFPSKHDELNIGAWEMTVHDLAKLCDIDVPEASLENFSDKGSTFLVKRFDRKPKNSGLARIHFASAMNLLGKTDGQSSETSYLDIAAFIKSYGATPKKDLLELWKRIVFNIAVSNTDDHLRNHGFLLANDGWHLSPAYDINPVYYGKTLSLKINAASSFKSMDLAIETCIYYDINLSYAKEYISNINSIIKDNWRKCAEKNGISRGQQEIMKTAFEYI